MLLSLPFWLLCAGITPTHQQLLEELGDLDTEWYLFGAILGMNLKQLNKIKASYGHELERCKSEMLRCWLENKAGATWNDVVQSLEKADKEVLAAKVKQKYLLLATGGDKEGKYRYSCNYIKIKYIPLLVIAYSNND